MGAQRAAVIRRELELTQRLVKARSLTLDQQLRSVGHIGELA